MFNTTMQIAKLLQRVHARDEQALRTAIPLVSHELKPAPRLARAWLHQEMAG